MHLLAQMLKTAVKRRIRLAWLGWRDERSRIELAVVAKAALKPHREFAGHSQLMQRFAMVAFALVNGRVAHAPQVVEERPLRRSDDVLLPQPIDELLLPLLLAEEKADLRGRALGEDLTELA